MAGWCNGSTQLQSCQNIGSNPVPAPIIIMKGCVTTTSTTISSTAFSSVVDAVTAQISVSSVVEVLVYAVPVVIGLVFMWWGVRKVVRMVMSAFKKGRISV